MSIFSVSPAVIMLRQFSLVQIDGHRYHDSPLPKTSSPSGWKLHKIWSVDSQQNYKNWSHQLPDSKAKSTKFDFGWGSAPNPAGELTVLPQIPYLDLRGLLLRGGIGEGRWKGKGREGRDSGWGGEWREGRKGQDRRQERGKGCLLLIGGLVTPLP